MIKGIANFIGVTSSDSSQSTQKLDTSKLGKTANRIIESVKNKFGLSSGKNESSIKAKTESSKFPHTQDPPIFQFPPETSTKPTVSPQVTPKPLPVPPKQLPKTPIQQKMTSSTQTTQKPVVEEKNLQTLSNEKSPVQGKVDELKGLCGANGELKINHNENNKKYQIQLKFDSSEKMHAALSKLTDFKSGTDYIQKNNEIHFFTNASGRLLGFDTSYTNEFTSSQEELKALFQNLNVEQETVENLSHVSHSESKDAQPQVTEAKDPFPKFIADLKVVNKAIGGSTGASLVESDGNKLIKKTAAGDPQKIGHVKAEYHADKCYQSMGAKVPEKMIYYTTTSQVIKGELPEGHSENISGVATLSEFKNNTISLKEYLNSASVSEESKQKTKDALCQHFVVDCILGNYDVVGLASDNVLVDTTNGQPWRIDNGSSFNYQAQGGIKPSQFWGPNVTEIDNMRNPNFAFHGAIANAGKIFKDVTNEMIKEQLQEVVNNRENFLAAVPEEHKGMINQRIDNLIGKYL